MASLKTTSGIWVLVMSLTACETALLPDPSSGNPVFTSTFTIDGEAISFQSGEEGFENRAMTEQDEIKKSFQSVLRQKNCQVGCHPLLMIEIAEGYDNFQSYSSDTPALDVSGLRYLSLTQPESLDMGIDARTSDLRFALWQVDTLGQRWIETQRSDLSLAWPTAPTELQVKAEIFLADGWTLLDELSLTVGSGRHLFFPWLEARIRQHEGQLTAELFAGRRDYQWRLNGHTVDADSPLILQQDNFNVLEVRYAGELVRKLTFSVPPGQGPDDRMLPLVVLENLKALYNFSSVSITYVDAAERRFESHLISQPSDSFFEVLAMQTYEEDGLQGRHYKLESRFRCMLRDDTGREITMRAGEGTFLFRE